MPSRAQGASEACCSATTSERSKVGGRTRVKDTTTHAYIHPTLPLACVLFSCTARIYLLAPLPKPGCLLCSIAARTHVGLCGATGRWAAYTKTNQLTGLDAFVHDTDLVQNSLENTAPKKDFTFSKQLLFITTSISS